LTAEGARLIVLAAIVAAIATPVHAAHPLLSEDTGTQGTGHVELELGGAYARDGELRAFEFGPQLSAGLAERVDLIVRPTWIENRSAGEAGTRASGAGDTALDGKWRFYDGDAISLATRVGILVPSGNASRGLGQGKWSFHGVLAAQGSTGQWTLIGNLGYVQDPVAGERSSLWYVTAAAVWQPADRLRFSAEAAAYTPPDLARTTWQAVARIGAIVSITSWLDVDAGYQFRLNHAAPVQVLLAGATIRW